MSLFQRVAGRLLRALHDFAVFHHEVNATERLDSNSFADAFHAEELESQRSSLFRADPANLQKSETPMSEGEAIDHLVQMNMGEIRTRAHLEFPFWPSGARDYTSVCLQPRPFQRIFLSGMV